VTAISARHRLEYWAVRAAACELLQLPPKAAFAVAETAGVLARRVLKGRSRTGRENLSAAYPTLTEAEVEALLDGVYRNLFRTVAEIFHLRRLIKPNTWRSYIEVENGERALDVFIEGRGGILVAGHLGNWELLGHALPYIGLDSQALARRLDNPLLDEFILGVRQSGLQRIILKQGSGALIEKRLSEGGFISILVDQDAGHKGVFVPFFGRMASTWRTPALLSQKTGAPILPGCCVRVGRGIGFKVIVGRPIYPNPNADVSAETLRMTANFTRQLEEWVRAYPEQYLWLHRRWKSAPGPRSLVAREA